MVNIAVGLVEDSGEGSSIADGPFMASDLLAGLAVADTGETQWSRPTLMCNLIDFGGMISEAADRYGQKLNYLGGIGGDRLALIRCRHRFGMKRRADGYPIQQSRFGVKVRSWPSPPSWSQGGNVLQCQDRLVDHLPLIAEIGQYARNVHSNSLLPGNRGGFPYRILGKARLTQDYPYDWGLSRDF